MPLILRDLGLAPVHHSMLYLPVMLGSIAAMVPFIILAERRGTVKQVFLGAVASGGAAGTGPIRRAFLGLRGRTGVVLHGVQPA